MEIPWSDYLNPTVTFFNISHLYTKTKPKSNGGSYEGADPVFVLYEAKEKNEYPPILIVDKKELVNIREPILSLTVVGEGAKNLVDEYLEYPPERVAKRLIKILQENAVYVKTEEWITGKDGNPRKKTITPEYSKLYMENGLLIQPKPILKDLNMVRSMDWLGFVDKILFWEAKEMDPRLVLINKTHLLKGVEPRANSHALEVFNAGVGKSIHFIVHGINFDKALRNAFLGYAKSPTEIYKGTVDGTELPIGIDQVEVGNWGLFDFMFNVMEYGKSRVSSGSVDFDIESKSAFSILANPLGESVDMEKGFGIVLDHLTKNPAIGRRFGVIGYSKKYAEIKTRSTPESMDQWKLASNVFRAIEQSAKDKLKEIYQNKDVWNYLGKEIPGYNEQVEKLTKDTNNSVIKSFLRAHGSAGQPRVRAASLSASLVDHLNEIALGEYDLIQIIEHADEILPNIAQINLESIGEMVENLDDEIQFYALGWLRNAPGYLQEIIYAVEQTRRQSPLGNSFILNTSDYTPSSTEYTHISQCIIKLLKRKRGIEEYAEKCQKWFGFLFKPMGKDLEIILERVDPIPWVAIPIGKIGQKTIEKTLPVLPDLPNSTYTENNTVVKTAINNSVVPEITPKTAPITYQPDMKDDKSSKDSSLPNGVNWENRENTPETILKIPTTQSEVLPDLPKAKNRENPLERMKRVLSVVKNEHGCIDDYIASRTSLPIEEVERILKALEKDRIIWQDNKRLWRVV